MLARLAAAFCLCLIASLTTAQGGQGGMQGPQGGGMGGGGIQGGSANFSTDSDEFSRDLFLTPGDRTEWTFEAKENDTVFVRITSSTFDPAVAIEDEKGTKLVENDD